MPQEVFSSCFSSLQHVPLHEDLGLVLFNSYSSCFFQRHICVLSQSMPAAWIHPELAGSVVRACGLAVLSGHLKLTSNQQGVFGGIFLRSDPLGGFRSVVIKHGDRG